MSLPADPRIVITGANRGIGLGFVRRYLATGARIVATVRDRRAASELNDLAARNPQSLEIVRCDVTDPEQVDRFTRELPWSELDLLINNAGGFGAETPTIRDVDFDLLGTTIAVNTIAPLRITQRLWTPLERARGRIVFMTSLMGSIADSSGGRYEYRISKCALNMVANCVGHDCRERGMVAFALHPGWVRTRMGGEGAPLSVEDSVAAMIETIGRASVEQNGALLDRNGERLPW